MGTSHGDFINGLYVAFDPTMPQSKQGYNPGNSHFPSFNVTGHRKAWTTEIFFVVEGLFPQVAVTLLGVDKSVQKLAMCLLRLKS